MEAPLLVVVETPHVAGPRQFVPDEPAVTSHSAASDAALQPSSDLSSSASILYVAPVRVPVLDAPRSARSSPASSRDLCLAASPALIERSRAEQRAAASAMLQAELTLRVS